MKSLSQIQGELRALSDQVGELCQALEVLEQRRPDTDPRAVYDKIERLAVQYPIPNKKVRASDPDVRSAYCRILSYIVGQQREELEPKLLFVQRIAAGANYRTDPERLLQEGALLDETSLEEAVTRLRKHAFSLLLDSLLAVNLTGTASVEQLELVAELACALSVDQADLALLAGLARCLIQLDERAFAKLRPADGKKWRGAFGHHIPSEWLLKNRIECGKYTFRRSKTWYNVSTAEETFRLQEGSFVRKGEKVAEYKDDAGKSHSVKALCDGYVYYQDAGGTVGSNQISTTRVYVCSCFDDLKTVHSPNEK